jgi:hypothetical protein
MTTLRRILLVVPIAAVAVLVATSSALAPSASAADGAPPISASEATRRFERLAPGSKNTQATLVNDADGRHRHYKVVSDRASGHVDASDGHVSTVVILPAVPTGTSVRIDQGAAVDRASAYLEQGGVATPGLTAQAQLVDHGSYKEWAVRWQRRVNGALAPGTLEVSVNPDNGAVFSLVNIPVPFVSPPTPKILRSQAETIARKYVGWASSSIDASDLVVAFAPDGTQVLAWQVVVSSTRSGVAMHARLNVDALNGSVTELGRG